MGTRFPGRLELPIHWGELDAFQHVNNLTYFRWFESGRMDYLARVGYLDQMEASGQGPILAHTDCRFRAPLAWPGAVIVQTGVEDLQEDRFLMRYRVSCQATGRLAAEGSGRMVSYDYRLGAKCPLPPAVRSAVEALEEAARRSSRNAPMIG
jgi:acyl-CoA thioester hydrolase